jgi:hypothetical protein
VLLGVDFGPLKDGLLSSRGSSQRNSMNMQITNPEQNMKIGGRNPLNSDEADLIKS